jgi:hypothetical protein
MASVTGSLGGQPIVLDNAATEATMKQILAALQKNGGAGAAAGGAALASKAGLDPSKIAGANKAVDAMSKSGSLASAGLSKMAGGIGIAAEVIGGLANSAVAVGKDLTALGQKAIDGKAQMSDFFGAFKQLPIVGVVAGLFEQLAKIQQDNLNTYRELTNNGINFGGSLQQVRKNALAMGMSLEEFSATMGKNKDIFVGLGGTVDGGAKAFTGVTKALKDSKLGDQMLSLGYNFTQMADVTANYIRVSGGVAKSQKEDYAAVAAAAANYAKETDLLARLTGQSREEQEKQMAEASKNAAWEAKLAQMDPLEKAKATEALKKALALGGKGAADALQSQILGFPPMTEEAQKFTAMMSSTAGTVKQLGDTIYDGKDAAQTKADQDRLLAKGQIANQKDLNRLGETAKVLAFTNDSMISAATKNATQLKNAGVTTEEAALDRIKKEREAQEALGKSEAAKAADAEKGMKKLGESLMAFVAPLLEKLQPLMTNMIKGLSDWLGSPAGQKGLENFGDALAKIVAAMGEYMMMLFSEKGREKIMADLKYGFQLLMIQIRKALDPFYTDAKAAKDEAALKANKEIDDAKYQNAQNEKERADKLAALSLANDSEKMKAKAEENKNRQKQIEELQKEGTVLTEENKKKLKELKQQQAVSMAEYAEAKAIVDDPTKKSAYEADAKKLGADRNANADKSYQKGAESHMLAGAATGALTGAAVGSVVPIIGTAVGAAIGGILGAWAGFADGTAGTSGSLMRDFGAEGSPAMLHGKEAVLTEQQLTNLAKGAQIQGAQQSQEALIAALNTLNKQTAQLVAINAQAADYNKRLVEKFEWAGNLFS